MADFVRVLVEDAAGNKSEHSVRVPMPGMTVLDKPAVDSAGNPLPRKEHSDISTLARRKGNEETDHGNH